MKKIKLKKILYSIKNKLPVIINVIWVIILVIVILIEFMPEDFILIMPKWIANFICFLHEKDSFKILTVLFAFRELVHSQEKNKVLKENNRLIVSLERPVIGFAKRSEIFTGINLGKGVAINLKLLKFSKPDSKPKWTKSVDIKILAPGQDCYEYSKSEIDLQKKIIEIGDNCDIIACVYEDIFRTQYFSYMDKTILEYCDISNKIKNSKHENVYDDVIDQIKKENS